MCGISGKYNFSDGTPIEEGLIQRMNDVVKHRGPDDEGIFISKDKNMALGHRRLSIIDLTPSGHQPMSNEDETIWIVYNGEVYNFLELKEDLEKKGHRFKSKSDTEVIIHLYEDCGIECVKYLRGMFAFAIWDERKKRLFLARDRLGKKPLNYTVNNGSLIFGSEIKSILQDPNVKREVNLESLHHYLTYQYIPHPLTMFQGIKKLPPAHILVCEKGNIKIECYWNLSYANKVNMSEEEIGEQILNLLKESIRIRLISDVPLGAFLSGGIDSSATVAMMAQLMDQPVKTFSIGFEEQEFSELKYARIIAKHFGTDHHEFIVKPKTIEVLPRLIWHYNEPYADSSALPTYYLSKVTREYVTVALNGDAGDENFAGYPRYVVSSIWHRRAPSFLTTNLFSRLGKIINEAPIKRSIFNRPKLFLKLLTMKPEERYLRFICFFNNDFKYKLYSRQMRELVKDINSEEILFERYSSSDGRDFIDKLLSVDVATYLPDDLLVKVDIASMAHSLEARSPFLDHKLMEFSASIPSNLKLRGRTNKYILKKALSKLLPDKILYRQKMGFGIPIDAWFRGELKPITYQILLDKKSSNRGYFNMEFLKMILDSHTSGKANHGNRIWALLVLELWHRMFIDSNRYDPCFDLLNL